MITQWIKTKHGEILCYVIKTKKRFGKGYRTHYVAVYDSMKNKRFEDPIWGRPIESESCFRLTFPV